jgi:hypothetical protein
MLLEGISMITATKRSFCGVFNEMFIYSKDRTGEVTYPEIAKTGANAVRFMWMTDASVPLQL